MKVHGKRALLNSPGHQTTAAIVAEIEDTSAWPPGKTGKGTPIKERWQAEPEVAVLRISDCDRAIGIALDTDTPAEWRNSIHKVEIMIDALTQLRDGMLIERDAHAQRVKGMKRT